MWNYLVIESTLALVLPKLNDIVEHHLRGADFGIRVDPVDGLLTQSAPGYQLTWMDAKVDDWVVTPRRGKPVEINGLCITRCVCSSDGCRRKSRAMPPSESPSTPNAQKRLSTPGFGMPMEITVRCY
jgi:hypothetical protein